VPNRNGAVTSAVLVHLRVEPAHFDWRGRERPALALLAWEALARDPLGRLRRTQVESIGTIINFRPAAITHRDIAASALPIASRLALTAGVEASVRRAGPPPVMKTHRRRYSAASGAYLDEEVKIRDCVMDPM
jgi:hypothetical protein